MWKEGNVRLGGRIYWYNMKVYDEASAYGINEGRISKLVVKFRGGSVAAYDRGWDLAPVDANAQAVVDHLVKMYQ